MALYLAIQIGAALSKVVPRRLRYLVGTVVGDLVYWIWASKRRTLLRNMSTVTGLGPTDPRVRTLAVKAMRNYCKYLIEFLELPNLSSRDEVVASMRIHGIEHLKDALGRGKGIILASAHFGTIELAGLRLADFTNFHAVYDTFRPAYLDQLIQRKRREKGIGLIPASNVKEMLRVLKQNGTLTVLFDRPLERAKGVPVRFFGRETAVPGGPAVLAMKTGATILPVYVFRQPDRTFEGVFFPPITWTPSGQRERDVQAIMQKLMETLQSVVARRPDQWYMFRPMWPDDVQGLPAGTRAAPSGEPVL